MFGKGIKLARIFGIEIWIDYSWLIIFVLIMWTLSKGFFPSQYPGLTEGTYFLMGILSALTLFASVLLHELSHSYVAQKSGIPVPRITLFVFGGVAQIAEEPRSARDEFNIAIAGPICSITLAVVFWLLSKLPVLAGDVRWVAILSYLAYVNLALVVFNMIPGFPLDGGRVLRAYLWSRWENVRKATYTVSKIGSGFGTGLIVFGGFNVLMGNIIGGVWLIFIGMFLNTAAKSGYQMTVLKDALKGVRVGDVMTREPVTVSPYISVADLVRDFFYRYKFVSFPVVDSRDEFVGIVSLNQVRDVPQSEWSAKTVGEVMAKPPQIKTLTPDDDVMEALGYLMADELGRVPVLSADGKVVGIITRRDIMTLLTIKTDLGF